MNNEFNYRNSNYIYINDNKYIFNIYVILYIYIYIYKRDFPKLKSLLIYYNLKTLE